MTSSLLVGDVVHSRTGDVRRRFRYRHCAWLFDLDDLDRLQRELAPLFGVDRRRPLSLRTDTHLPLDAGATLRERTASCLARHDRPTNIHRVLLVSGVATCGYGFDPVSWICCHDERGRLHTIIADVHNTFGESHTYVLPADQLVPDEQGWLRAELPKAFHVSPFLPLDLHYELSARPPSLDMSARAGREVGESVEFCVTVRDGDGTTRFVGLQRGCRRPITRRAVLGELLRDPLRAQRVTLRIHTQALRLWLRRAPFHRKPEFTPHAGSDPRSAA